MKKYILLILFCTLMLPWNKVLAADTPQVDAQGAILIDFKTGRVLWEKNSDTALAMASTTKIMTAMLALECSNIDDIVIVSKKAAATPPVVMGLTSNEKIKMSALLYALMMQSSNDAAVAIAEHIGGSVDGFCAIMNQKAIELGCKDTRFETPNGLDAGDHHSTAADMAIIAKYALGNEDFVKLINTQHVTVESDKRQYDIINKNRLLHEFSGAIGVKTGYTGKAGHCFVGAAERDGMQLISVVLASGWGNKGKEQKWVDTKRVLQFGFDNYKYMTVINEKDKACSLIVERSRTGNVDGYYSEGVELPVTEKERAETRVKILAPESMKAPIAEGQLIGVAEIYVGGQLYKSVNILTASSAERHDLKTSLEKVLDEFISMGTRSGAKIILPEF